MKTDWVNKKDKLKKGNTDETKFHLQIMTYTSE